MLRETDRSSVAELTKKNKVTEQAIYGWRKLFNGLEPQDIKRLKTLETENAKLKKLLTERDLEIHLMLELIRKEC